MAAGKRISVLIPLYNAAPWLDECLRSIVGQTTPPDEIILVDDGSTDGSDAVCARWAAAYSAVRVIRQENSGVAAARNTALREAAGDLLMPVDADDWLEPDCLEKLLELMQRQQTPIAACNHWIEQKKRRRCFTSDEAELKLTAEQALEGVLYHRIPDVSCWAKLYKREVFEGLRYPEGKLYEDTWLIAPVLMAAGSMAWTSKPLYHYRIRANSISRSVWGPEKLDLLEAVQHLMDCVRAAYPRLEAGCIRRQAHAALSIRRYFVDCGPALYPQRDELERIAVGLSAQVLRDAKAPMRDKVALLALRCGPWAYDLLWKWMKHG